MKAHDSQNHRTKLHHWQGPWWWIIPALFVAIVIWSVLALAVRGLPPEVLLAGMAVLLGVAYFLQQQHLQQARFFKELVTDFNLRYDKLNDYLLKYRSHEEEFDEQKFVDYFNLCAEEWLFYSTGYIGEPVWRAWCNGMKQFVGDEQIADLWRQECETESFYGFDFLRETQCDLRRKEQIHKTIAVGSDGRR